MSPKLAAGRPSSSWSGAMNLTLLVILLMETSGCAPHSITAPEAWADRENSEVARSMDELAQSVVRTVQRELGGREASEIEEIRYEGVPVLYEAEVEAEDDSEYELTVYPDGQLAECRQSDDDEDEDNDDDEEEGDDD